MNAGRSGAVKGQGQPTVRERKPMVTRKLKGRQDEARLLDDLSARIAARAYAFYERRGYEDGYDREDWLEAERKVLTEEP